MRLLVAEESEELEVPERSAYSRLASRAHARPLFAGAAALLAAALAAVGFLAVAHAAGRSQRGRADEEAVQLAQVEEANCSKAGENCLASACCVDVHLGCYKKDDDYATCHPGCIPGEEDPHDKGKFRTPWNCTLLGAKPKPMPPPPLPPANSGCFVSDDDKVLVVRHAWGQLDIPGGTADAGEASDVTAARETFEETGYKVHVKELKEVTPNGFHIYNCVLLPPYHPVGAPDPREVAAVIWLPKKQLWSSGAWRFPDEVASFFA